MLFCFQRSKNRKDILFSLDQSRELLSKKQWPASGLETGPTTFETQYNKHCEDLFFNLGFYKFRKKI